MKPEEGGGGQDQQQCLTKLSECLRVAWFGHACEVLGVKISADT